VLDLETSALDVWAVSPPVTDEAGPGEAKGHSLVWAFSELLVEPMESEGIFELYRQYAEAAEQRDKPQPTKAVYAPGSMEWLAEQKKSG
jgi:hypothetical protein